MTKKHKKNEPDPTELKLEKWLSKVWVFIKRESKIAFKSGKNWIFFYQPHNKVDEMIHIMDILIIIYLVVRLANKGI